MISNENSIGQLIQYWERSDCPAPEERPELKQDWSCEDFISFETTQRRYVITCYVFKSIQVLVFLVLFIVLAYDRCHQRSHIGKLPIMISVLAVLNAAFAIIRINAVFPSFSKEEYLGRAKCFYCLESICYLGSQWFFSIKYFETAYDLKCILENGLDEGTIRRKRNCLVLRWTIFSLLVVTNALLTWAWIDESLSITAFRSFTAIGFSVQALMLFSLIFLMSAALCIYIRFVKQNGAKSELNHFFIIGQILCLSLLGLQWCIQGFFIIQNYGEWTEFHNVKSYIIIDACGIGIANTIFWIIAYVIYMSSRVNKQSKDLSLLSYLQEQHSEN